VLLDRRVTVDGSSVGAVSGYTFTNVQAGHTIAASFVQNPSLTITASAASGGSITPSGGVSVGCGGDQSFAISGDGCHSIADVVVDGGSVGAVSGYTFTNVQNDHTIAGDVQPEHVHGERVGRDGRLDLAERPGIGRLRHGPELHGERGSLLLDRRRHGGR
jgi:hypothetical protein